MTFLDEAMLGFLALAAIPIIIHLLNRRNFKIVDWAAIRFLLESMQKNSRRLQIQDIILLILRTLAILLIVLAIARPLLAPGGLLSGHGGEHVVILLDNSMSMTLRRGNGSRFDAAKRAAEGVVAGLPRGSRAAAILFNATGRVIARPSADLSFVRQAIAAARPSDAGTDVAGALSKAATMLKRMGGGGAIYLVSDMQSNAFPSRKSASWPAWRKLLRTISARKHIELIAVKIGHGAPPSLLSVDNLKLADPLVHAGQQVRVLATVVNHSATPASNVHVSLYRDDARGKMRKVASAIIARLAHRATVGLRTTFLTGGPRKLTVRLSPQPLPACAARRLVLQVMKHVRVLLIDGAANAGRGSAGGALFIKAALAPADSNRPRRVGSAAPLVSVKTVRMGQLAGASLDGYQAVIFSDVASVPKHYAAGLRAFVRAGGAMIVFAGPRLQAASYDANLFNKTGLLPAALGSATPLGSPVRAGGAGIGLAVNDLANPVFSFFKTTAYRAFLLQPRFQRAFAVAASPQAMGPGAMPKPKADGTVGGTRQKSLVAVIARFANGAPAIMSRGVGRGTVILFTTSAGKKWSDFPLCPAFVMILRRALFFSLLSAQPNLNGRVGRRIAVPVASRHANAKFVLTGPGGGARTVRPGVLANGTATVALDHTRLAGYYTLRRGRVQDTFAINWPSREADPRALSATGIRSAFPGVNVQVSGGKGAAVNGAGGMPLWPIFFGLAVACLLAESVLALHWAPEGRA